MTRTSPSTSGAKRAQRPSIAPVLGFSCSISTSTMRPTQAALRWAAIGCCSAIRRSLRWAATSAGTGSGSSAAGVPSSGEKVNTPT